MLDGHFYPRLGSALRVAPSSLRTWQQRRSRIGGAVRHLAGGLALLGALVGLPVALIITRRVWLDLALDLDVAAIVAEPLSPSVLVLAAVAAVVLLWVWLVVATTVDAVAVFMHGARTARLLPAPLRATVTTLAGSLLMAVTTVTASVSAAGAAPAASTALHTTSLPTEILPATVGGSPGIASAAAVPTLVRTSMSTAAPALRQVNRVGAAAGRGERQPMTVTVTRGDTLWSIAERCLGDPHRWQEIYRLNAGRYDRAGRMAGGDHIEPSWVLTLPSDAQEPPAAVGSGADSGDVPAAEPPVGEAQPGDPEPTTATTGQPADDGVTGQQPTASPSGATETLTADPAGPGTGPTDHAGDAGRAGAPRPPGGAGGAGIGLSSGSWVDAGVAAAVLAAAALVWAHRRRRYVPRAPAGRPDDTVPAAMPSVVRMLRRSAGTSPAVAARTAPTGRPINVRSPVYSPDPDLDRDFDLDDDLDDDFDGAGLRSPGGAAEPDPADRVVASGATGPASAGSYVPAVDRWPGAAGLGLVGPGAHAAARGLLVTAAGDGLDDPAARTVVMIPAAVARRLFGGLRLPDTPRIVVTSTLSDALTQLEAMVLHRSRVLQQYQLTSVAQVHRVEPLEEPMPPTILLTDNAIDVVADADADAFETGDGFAGHRGRVVALLRQGGRLGVHGVLLGDWPDGDTVAVGVDGTTSPAGDRDAQPAAVDHRPGGHAADVGRMTVLTVGEALDLLTVLAESHTGEPPTFHTTGTAGNPNDDQASAPTSSADSTGLPVTSGPGATTDAGIASAAAATPAAAVPPDPTDGPRSEAGPGAGTVTAVEPQPAAAAADAADTVPGATDAARPEEPGRRVLVRLLGPPTLVDADTSRGTLRAKSLELLAYLAVHDGAAHYEAILDDLLPDAAASKAVHRLHTYISDLRQMLRRTGGATATYLTREGQRYLLNRAAFDIDLWRLRVAARESAAAGTTAERVAACQRVLEAYRGQLADGVDYEWIEPHREAARRQVIDAALTLAEAMADDPGAVTSVLDAAIAHSPYTEALYQAAMRANAALGRLDTVRALRHTLTQRLADLDTEPSEETTALANQLLTSAPTNRRRQPRRRDTSRPAAAATASPAGRAQHETRPAPSAEQPSVVLSGRSAGVEAAS